jgi:hypothetical protein
MKAFLMYKNRDFDLWRKLPWNEQALTQDLELNTLFDSMALEDKFLFEVAKSAVLSGLNNDLDTIRYRQYSYGFFEELLHCRGYLHIEPDMQIARIRLSDKISRLHPRGAAAELGQAYEPEVPV